MSLLAPGWLALLLLGLPIILLHRRRAHPRPYRAGNLFIWRRVLEQRPVRPQRTLPSLLLLLQLAALAAGALALAQPVLVRAPGERHSIHVILDTSASMMAPTPGGDRFQQALEELARYSARFPEAAYTLVRAAGLHPRIVARDVDRAALLHEANRLAPQFAPVSWEQAGRLLASLPSAASQVWLVGDGQGDALGALTSALQAAGRSTPVSLLAVGEPQPNLGVTAFSARPSGTSLERYAVLVEVTNASRQPAAVQLTVTVTSLEARDPSAGRVLLDRRLDLGARERFRLQEELTLPSEGLWELRASIDPRDPFPLDDAVSLVLLPPRPTLVYLVSERGDPWLRAFRALPEVAVTWRQVLPSQPPEGYDLVVYDGLLPDRLPAAASVVVPPGPDAGSAGRRGPAAGGLAGPGSPAPALPWALFYGEARSEAVRASWWDEDEPLFQFVDWSRQELRGVRPLRPRVGTRVLMDSSEGPLMIRLDDPPALLLGFDPGEGRLAAQPGFPVWVANLVQWANPQAWNRIAPTVGPGEILDPPGPGTLTTLAGEELASGAWQVDRPGVVRFQPEAGGGPGEAAIWARSTSPLPPAETDLTDVAPPLWVEPGADAVATAGVTQRELTRDLIILLGVLLLAELVLWLSQDVFGRAAPARRLRAWVPALAARAAVLALVAAAAAGVSRWVPSDLNELWVLLDRSRSVDPALQGDAWRWVDQLRADAGERRLGVVVFGGQAAVERSPDEPGRLPPAPGAQVSPDETDLEAALSLVSARVQPPARLVLVTDGHATRGEADLVVERLRELGVPADVVPLFREGARDVAIEQVRVRPQVDPGAPFLVQVAMRAGQPTSARLVLRAAGVPVAERRVELPVGSSAFELSARAPDTPQILPLEVVVEALLDERPENNRAEAAIRVGEPPRVVVARTGTSVVAPLLEAQGLGTTVLAPDELPTEPAFWEHAGALVMENLPAGALSREQQRAIAYLVRDLGGGLLVVGGPQAYASGGYRGTDLEELLPVSLSLPLDLLIPRVAMVLVIDRSGSMGEHQGQRTKLDLAKQASLSLLDNLSSDDLLGILAFDTQATWVVPLGRVGTGAGVLQRLAQLSPSGGTNLGPALNQAIAALEATPAVVKHVLLLSDGKSTPGPFTQRAREAAASNISLSTVAIGRDSDQTLMEDLAREGGGRYYYTDDLERLPEIFLREVRSVTAPQILPGPHPVAVLEREPFLLDGAEDFGPLERVNAASPREGATVHVATEAGRPVLSSWNFGLGRVVAFLSHPGEGWAAEWGGRPALWSQITRWILRPPAGLQASSTLEIASGTGVLTVDLLDLAGGYVNFALLEATVQNPDGSSRTVPLDQVGPGRYRASFAATLPGAYLATVRRIDPGEAAPVATATSWVAAAPELEFHPTPAPSLYELARMTGGRVLSLEDRFDQVWEATPGARVEQPLRLPLVLASLFLFIADLAFRLLQGRAPGSRSRAVRGGDRTR